MFHFKFDSKNRVYNYYRKSKKGTATKSDAVNLSKEILYPKLSNPDYLILVKRRENIHNFLEHIEKKNLMVLDIGGRIQPYRELLAEKIHRYISLDPIMEGLVDEIAVGEYLPFKSKSFDLVLSTQVLSYAFDPQQFIDETYRVLKPGGSLILSAPALFPLHHDEHWRFLPDGLRILLDKFENVDIEPEGHSIAGIERTIDVALNIFIRNRYLKMICNKTIIPFDNLIGKYFDRLSKNNDQFTVNYTCYARKPLR